jgi:hypothetical protein
LHPLYLGVVVTPLGLVGGTAEGGDASSQCTSELGSSGHSTQDLERGDLITSIDLQEQSQQSKVAAHPY